ncbi:MAG: hypothetical protein ACE5GM_11730, partial [bacterium]
SAKSPAVMRNELRNDLEKISDEERLVALVKYVRSEELRIGTRYLIGRTGGSFQELTGLADLYLQEVYKTCYRQLIKRYGVPVSNSGRKSGFAVIGFGKLGGREIDFGSDLDIMFLYEEGGKTTGGLDSIDNYSFFTKLSQLMVKTIKRHTRYGVSYLVDLDIRPEGKQGNLAVMAGQLPLYYEKRARLWEFQALLKARPVAGDNEGFFDYFNKMKQNILKSKDLKNISGQISGMLSEIRRQRVAPQPDVRDLKLGEGGIMDIEFLVQEIQLKHGVYDSNTLSALKSIQEKSLISPKQHKALKDAYLFFREVISRERLIEGRSCHTISTLPDQLEVLAKRLDYPADNNKDPGQALYNKYLYHTAKVIEVRRKT